MLRLLLCAVFLALLVLSMLLLLCAVFLALLALSNVGILRALPPGPISLPIVGSIFSLRYPLHRHFASLGKKYGPIIHLRGGTVDYIVVNSLAIAREVLSVRDLEFAYRPASKFGEYFSYGYKDIALAPYGRSWQMLKQITYKHLMCPKSLDGAAWIFEAEMEKSIKRIRKDSEIRAPINLTEALSKFTSNAFCLTFFGRTHERVLDLVAQIERQTLNVNIGNCFPLLDFLDLHGVNKRMKNTLMPELERLLREAIETHRQRKKSNDSQGEDFVYKDFIDVLSSLESLQDISIVALLTDLLVAGVDTIKWTVLWAMAEVIKNPKVMERAQEELKNTVLGSRLVKQSDLAALPYIQAIYKEALRLHPVGALGVPHHNPLETTIAGYKIPKSSTILVNVWAIGRDPKHWDDPEVFCPERFLGHQAKPMQELMIPFSAGRRSCPGMPIASRVVPFVVASLLHAFDWKSGSDGIDLTEKLAGTLSCMLASDLVVVPSPRLEERNESL